MSLSIPRDFSDFELNYARYLPRHKGAKILDIGCGRGRFISYLKWKGFTDVSGVDINSESVDFCKKNVTAQVFHIREPDQFLKDKEDTFDLIILMEVIYYFPDDRISDYFKSIHRALKHNGRIIVQAFNGCCLTGAYYKVRDHQIKRVYCDESLKGCVESMGFVVKHIEGRRYPIDSLNRLLWFCVQRLWHMILKIIYVIERGTSWNPYIFSRLFFCVAKKKG